MRAREIRTRGFGDSRCGARSRRRLQQRAARLDAAGGSPADARAGDDPMFLLKNIRAFAIDGL